MLSPEQKRRIMVAVGSATNIIVNIVRIIISNVRRK